jgi:hypothetical protein
MFLSIATAITMSAATCTTRTLRVMPTYTVVQEICVIQAQGQRPQRHVSTYRIKHPNHSQGGIPQDFVIPLSDR